MKVEFRMFIEATCNSFGIQDKEFAMNFTRFMVSNMWFGKEPVLENGNLLVEEQWIADNQEAINEFCSFYGTGSEDKVKYLLKKLNDNMPRTSTLVKKYCRELEVSASCSYRVLDFLLYWLPGEIDLSTDKEIETLVDDACRNLPKTYAEVVADFINWTSEKTKTIYQQKYFIQKFVTRDEETDAYEPNQYLAMLYKLYNAEYIQENDMYAKAARSKNYTDTWLFLSLHFLCDLRNTDIVRLPHPVIRQTPEIVLEQIEHHCFPDTEARLVTASVVWHLQAIMLVPNKTSGFKDIATIKMEIPESVEVHIGTLFALAEAHFQISGMANDKPLIRVISSYEQINRYMGDDIGDLFLNANFRSRAANKAHMQMIEMLTDDILGIEDEFNVKGYILAALARSHKHSYGDFARTTSIYLKDAKMNGFTPEFVAKEMFERGVLSMIPSMLLKMIMKTDYEKLSVHNQTLLVQELAMTPNEIESSISVMQSNMAHCVQIVQEIYNEMSETEILSILHRIGNGEAVSKQGTCNCLMTAMKKECPYIEAQNCPACSFEISTKTTMFLMIQEWKRLKGIFKTTDNDIERNRSKYLAQKVVVPAVEEMLIEIQDKYGTSVLEMYEALLEEK